MLEIEKDVESYLVKKVEAAGGMCLKFPTIHTEGIPDRLVLLPPGQAAFVETKRPKGGRLSEIQRYQINKLRNMGIQVYVISDKPGVDWFIRRMTKGTLKGCPKDESKCVFYDKDNGCRIPLGMMCQKEVINDEEENKSK